jgi:hypothetical protein
MAKITVDTKKVDKMLDVMDDLTTEATKAGFKTFKDETPVRKGNAKRNTVLRRGKIKANYSYAGRLDEGWSKKAPDGMSKPAIDTIDKFVDAFVRKVG